MNEVKLTGNIGKTERRVTPAGKVMVTTGIQIRNYDGSKDWINVAMNEKTAEQAMKGSEMGAGLVFIGHLYKGGEGGKYLNIWIDRVDFVFPDTNGKFAEALGGGSGAAEPDDAPVNDDDLPF